MSKPLTDAALQQGLLVQLELNEATDRLAAEGFGTDVLLAGIASLANDMVATQYGQAAASAWFFGMAKNAEAHLQIRPD